MEFILVLGFKFDDFGLCFFGDFASEIQVFMVFSVPGSNDNSFLAFLKMLFLFF
jgi:hypothetical protein